MVMVKISTPVAGLHRAAHVVNVATLCTMRKRQGVMFRTGDEKGAEAPDDLAKGVLFLRPLVVAQQHLSPGSHDRCISGAHRSSDGNTDA